MATNVEESDTDDHERPAPPKRHCTRLGKVNETENEPSEKEEDKLEIENVEYSDTERVAREKLKKWQTYQVANGCADNIINNLLEDEIITSCWMETFRSYIFKILEESAVMMAIENYGLVQSARLVSQPSQIYSNKAPGFWINNEYSEIHCSCPPNRGQIIEDFTNPLVTTSAGSLKLNNSSIDQYSGLNWDADKVDDNEQQENFLERAVAEAIKKKGLSVLSTHDG